MAMMTHVPTYCSTSCCTPPHDHTISQITYLKGSGGIEIPIKTDTMPFDTANGEMIDFDAVFRDDVDLTTFDLYIGCGRCNETGVNATIPSPSVSLGAYQDPEFEPFTQTAYRSLFAKENRTFNSSLLSAAECPEKYFTIYLVDYDNRTDKTPIVWGPVIGLKEEFTFMEILQFPIFVLRNHGSDWNEVGITYWILLGLGLATAVFWVAWKCFRKTLAQSKTLRVRYGLYHLALVGFGAAGIEQLIHLVIAHSSVAISGPFYIGVFLVILLAQGFPALLTVCIWHSATRLEGEGRGALACLASPRWAPLEILSGLSFFFLLGSGFYIGPAALTLAGIVRCTEFCSGASQMLPTRSTGPTAVKGAKGAKASKPKKKKLKEEEVEVPAPRKQPPRGKSSSLGFI